MDDAMGGRYLRDLGTSFRVSKPLAWLPWRLVQGLVLAQAMYSVLPALGPQGSPVELTREWAAGSLYQRLVLLHCAYLGGLQGLFGVLLYVSSGYQVHRDVCAVFPLAG